MTKTELILIVVASMDGENAPDDPVHLRNLNDDRTDDNEASQGIYQISDEHVSDEDGYLEIGFFGPVVTDPDEESEEDYNSAA